jgi:hypothetical protein
MADKLDEVNAGFEEDGYELEEAVDMVEESAEMIDLDAGKVISFDKYRAG